MNLKPNLLGAHLWIFLLGIIYNPRRQHGMKGGDLSSSIQAVPAEGVSPRTI